MKILIVSPTELTNENSCGICKIIFNHVLSSSFTKFDFISPKGSFSSLLPGTNFPYNKIIQPFSNLLQGKPKSFLTQSSIQEVKAQLDLLKDDYDIVHFFSYNFIPLLNSIPIDKAVISLIDSMPLFFKRRSIKELNTFKKVFYKIESIKYLRLEYRIPPNTKVHFVSSVDSEYFINIHNKTQSKVTTIENGISPSTFYPLDLKKKKEIIFFGNLSYSPNTAAVNFIAGKLAKELRKSLPNYKIVIIGRLDEKSRFTINNNVEFKGFVNNLNYIINQSRVAIFPIFFGTGIKNKVLESLATGIPIVATDVALEGININKASYPLQIISSKNEKNWSKAICEIVNKEELQKEPYIPFTWKRFSDKLNDLYKLP